MRSLPRLSALAGVLLALTMLVAPAHARAARTDGLPSKKVWLHDVAVAMKPAIPSLQRRVARGGDRLAVVLDIDNTALATHYAWPRPVRKTLAFARRAAELDVSVFFVTGRYAADAKRQRPTLRRAGYTVDGICGRRSGEGLVASKTRCRRSLVARGYTIIASVGNLPSDVRGGYVERSFDLPDYGRRLS
ncbi:MAG: HAD family acid phosphatase [Nocardioides sp.]|uniref:HAD family acid phosphatase n=1 Tax=Nocardioides sp. TaxID=35761 RepID=UPI0039E41D4D